MAVTKRGQSTIRYKGQKITPSEAAKTLRESLGMPKRDWERLWQHARSAGIIPYTGAGSAHRNPSPGRKSAVEQKMTFEKLHKPFKAWLSQVASEHGKSVEQVFDWWREYTQDCSSFDQSPVQSEFLDWYRDRLSASGRGNPAMPGRGESLYQFTRDRVAAAKRGVVPAPMTGDYPRTDLERWNQDALRGRAKCLDAMSAEEARLLAKLPSEAQANVIEAFDRAYSWLASQPLDFWRRYGSAQIGTPGKLMNLAMEADASIKPLLEWTKRGNPGAGIKFVYGSPDGRGNPSLWERWKGRGIAKAEREWGKPLYHRAGSYKGHQIYAWKDGTFSSDLDPGKAFDTHAELQMWIDSARSNPASGVKSAYGSLDGRGNPVWWELTKNEALDELKRMFPERARSRLQHSHFLRTHEDYVAEAIRQGKPVPEKVLRDYPELVTGHEPRSWNPESGIKFVYGILGKGKARVSEVQSVLFDKARYTLAQAREWLESHGFKFGAVDEGGPRAEYLRFRQQDPGKYSAMRTGEAGAKGNPMPTPKKLSEEIRHWGSKDAQRLPTELDTLGMVDRRFGPPVARSLSQKKIDSLVKAAREAFGERSNPSASALSEAFHGRPVKSETEYTDTRRTRAKLAELGTLVDIEIEDPPLTIEFKRGTKLASSPNGAQLFVVGGDQSVDLKPFKVDGSKDSVVLGVAEAVTYLTDKQHLGRADRTPGPYRHAFAENGKEPPLLLYDTRNRELSFSGGVYKIEKDMDGGFSAGIKD